VTFQVDWSDFSHELLAAVWLAAKDRNAVTKASDEIDNVLSLFPNSAGEPAFDTVRVFAQPPLAVEYEVIESERRVFVLSVWDTEHGRPEPSGN
jgi:hypothetical protein